MHVTVLSRPNTSRLQVKWLVKLSELRLSRDYCSVFEGLMNAYINKMSMFRQLHLCQRSRIQTQSSQSPGLPYLLTYPLWARADSWARSPVRMTQSPGYEGKHLKYAFSHSFWPILAKKFEIFDAFLRFSAPFLWPRRVNLEAKLAVARISIFFLGWHLFSKWISIFFCVGR